MKYWDHKRIVCNSHNEETRLAEMGKEGWELVNVTAPKTYEIKLYFKREASAPKKAVEKPQEDDSEKKEAGKDPAPKGLSRLRKYL